MTRLGTNRVLDAIERQRERIEQGVKPDGSPITGDLDAVEQGMALSPAEHFIYQERQAHAHAMGILTPDEAMTIYTALGEAGDSGNGGWARGADLSTKIVVTNVIAQLMGVPA